MTQNPVKVGLVLSGGGAKGAYEVGVVRALAELNIEPEVVSGASIGALNGAIVASSPNIQKAATELEMIWRGIDNDSVIKAEIPTQRLITLTSLHLLVRNFLKINPVTFFASLAANSALKSLFTDDDIKVFSLLDSSPLEKTLKENVDFSQLRQPGSRELYVSVFPAGTIKHIPEFLKSLVSYALSSRESEFKYVNKRTPEEILRLIMASAAIPIAFKPIKLDGTWYYDGGMGDRVKVQGNTPIKPLIDSNCSHAIIVMLSNGVLWDRAEWPQITSIEIRPSSDMGRLSSILDFNPAKINELMALGYQDTLRSIGKVFNATKRLQGLVNTSCKLSKTVSSLLSSDSEYNMVMEKISNINKII